MPAPGELYDCRGYPIHPGDLLRTLHFRDSRGKRYYLYHVAVLKGEHVYMKPVHYLEPSIRQTGGECRIDDQLAESITILAGYGPGRVIHFEDRTRRGEKAAPRKKNDLESLPFTLPE